MVLIHSRSVELPSCLDLFSVAFRISTPSEASKQEELRKALDAQVLEQLEAPGRSQHLPTNLKHRVMIDPIRPNRTQSMISIHDLNPS